MDHQGLRKEMAPKQRLSCHPTHVLPLACLQGLPGVWFQIQNALHPFLIGFFQINSIGCEYVAAVQLLKATSYHGNELEFSAIDDQCGRNGFWRLIMRKCVPQLC